MQAAPRGREQDVVSPRFRKQLLVLWEPREFGECGDKSAFGDVFNTFNEDPV